ncbi:MAG: LacI family DNA-binding transcriptional regulator [Alphaproteobacteria bacterium]|nr:LacI family DNA-binding transcriptional regulator [Alphaproteobacteria bacterium]
MSSLKQIANDLGLSVASVSNALSGKGRVSPAVTKRVLSRANELGYKPNAAARALKTGRSHILGFVLPDITHPLFAKFAQGIESAADAVGYGVLIADSRDDGNGQAAAITRLVQRGVDGLVIVPRRGSTLTAQSIPMAVINSQSDPMNTVSANHFQGGMLAAETLLKLGHNHFLLLGADSLSDVQKERIAGMQRALSDQAKYKTIWADKMKIDIATLHDEGITAVIAVSDLSALNIMSSAHQVGLKIPEDLSVVGFDDLPICKVISPQLSSLAPDVQEIARQAIEFLCLSIDGAEQLPKSNVINMSFISRDSTASPTRK